MTLAHGSKLNVGSASADVVRGGRRARPRCGTARADFRAALLGWGRCRDRRGGGMDLDFILRANPDYVEDLYRQYPRDPQLRRRRLGALLRRLRVRRATAVRRPAAAHQAERVTRRLRPDPLLPRARPPRSPTSIRSAATHRAIRCSTLERVRLHRGRPRPRRRVPDASAAAPQRVAARADRAAARDLLRHARRRVHGHLRQGAARLAAGAHGADAQPAAS